MSFMSTRTVLASSAEELLAEASDLLSTTTMSLDTFEGFSVRRVMESSGTSGMMMPRLTVAHSTSASPLHSDGLER